MSEERAIELVRREPAAAIEHSPAMAVQSLLPTEDDLRTMITLADKLADTEFVPTALRKRPAAVLACIMAGREMSVGPMQSLQSIHIIGGRPTLSAQLMRALVLRSGNHFRTVEVTDEAVTVAGRRRGETHEQTVTFGIKEARQAKLAGDNYGKYPQDMFLARATSRLCRAMFPDVLAGFGYTPEEAREFSDAPAVPVVEETDAFTGEMTPVKPTPAAKPAPQKAKQTPAPAAGQRLPVTLLEWRKCFHKQAVAAGWTDANVTAIFAQMLDPKDSDADQIALIKDMGISLMKGQLGKPGEDPFAGQGETTDAEVIEAELTDDGQVPGWEPE